MRFFQKIHWSALLSLMGMALLFTGCGSKSTPSSPASSPAPSFPTFSFFDFFGLSGSATMDEPTGIGVSGNEIWVSNATNNTLQAWSEEGALALSIHSYGTGPTVFHNPCEVSVGPDGYVYVIDQGNYQAVEFTPTGQYVTVFGNTQLGTDLAYGLGVNGSKAYLLDETAGVVRPFTITGSGSSKTFTAGTPFGNSGTTVISTIYAYGMGLDGSGNIYVADTYNNRVLKYNSSGALQMAITSGLSYPDEPAIDSAGDIFVVDDLDANIHAFNSAGVSMSTFGGGDLSVPSFGIALDGSGNLLVASFYGNDVVEFQR